jgi:transposase
MNTATIGLDIAKNVFQVHGVDQHGKPMLQRKLLRGEVLRFFAKVPQCLVGIEACHSSHFWGRELLRVGHNV